MEADERGFEQSEEELMRIAESLCSSKAVEFAMLGYDQVTASDIWDCVSSRYQKTGFPPLHSMVNDILSLRATTFMNWMTMQAFKGVPF